MKPALTFSTLHPLTTIDVDGKTYNVRHPDSLSLIQFKQMERHFPTLGAILTKDTITDEDVETLRPLLERTCAAICDAPAEVQARLTDKQLIEIVMLFIELRSPTQARVTGVKMRQKSSGEKSSRGSRDSTADRRSHGSTRSR